MNPAEPDLPRLIKLRPLIRAVAESYGLSPALLAAVISRESGAGRLLGKWGNPPDTGDRGHGRGLMQIDDRFWKGALDLDGDGEEEDAWRHPAFNLALGAWILKKNLEAIGERFPGLSDETLVRAALSAYNAGLSRTLRALSAGEDPDRATAGGDYARDVLARAEFLRERGWEES